MFAVLAAVTGIVFGASPAAADAVSMPLRSAVAALPVDGENRTGYARTKFQHWVDADRDGCNTRYEVLIAEAVTKPKVGTGCALSGGRWYSYFDDAYWTVPADLDIDHVVALAEAWDSGASEWTASQRRSYANDLSDGRPLVAVTDNVNQSKSDQDPADWMPSYVNSRCRYIEEWVAIKLRWRLTVDEQEREALTDHANGCANVTLTVTRAI
jgi:hypothetical protein